MCVCTVYVVAESNSNYNLISGTMSSRWQTIWHSSIAAKSLSYLSVCRIKRHQLERVYHLKMHTNSANYSGVNVDNILRTIFLSGVQAVRAKAIFSNNKCFAVAHNPTNQNIVVKVKAAAATAADNVVEDMSATNGRCSEFHIDAGKCCHLVGFGKAVHGMAIEMVRVLGDRLISGILSVPFGTGQTLASDNLVDDVDRRTLSSKITVLEGAEHNLPDAAAEQNARRIKAFVKNLNKNDVLFILITGGGSALLPLCCDGITLPEKCAIIKQLSAQGATINDINTVRIDLSAIKGGKLAAAASNAHLVIALIVSDIINSPIHLIASGPTTVAAPNASAITEQEEAAAATAGATSASAASANNSQNILGKYGLWSTLPARIQETIVTNSQRPIKQTPANVRNFIIANNQSAVNAAMTEANAHGFATICISTEINGLVADLSEAYVAIAVAIIEHRAHRITTVEFHNRLYRYQSLLHFNDTFESKLLNAMQPKCTNGICLIGGGEPTVKITGNGLGGRNQELALRFSIKCQEHYANDILQDVALLSAGTDGIDGTYTNTI